MSVDFYESKTRVNLMRAFAGESLNTLSLHDALPI